eukprot:TRINITY_DN10550_c0_g1_i1.p1 TRINITY_DN10550_c0_g1~~TRINITY_DN10550_c0_g1_i1.p1  ORF type:complete len:205 (-),score=9.76 TRINITY_DN10550_c0_g1_i1:131-745(-)
MVFSSLLSLLRSAIVLVLFPVYVLIGSKTKTDPPQKIDRPPDQLSELVLRVDASQKEKKRFQQECQQWRERYHFASHQIAQAKSQLSQLEEENAKLQAAMVALRGGSHSLSAVLYGACGVASLAAFLAYKRTAFNDNPGYDYSVRVACVAYVTMALIFAHAARLNLQAQKAVFRVVFYTAVLQVFLIYQYSDAFTSTGLIFALH